jgi:hypothetical protein
VTYADAGAVAEKDSFVDASEYIVAVPLLTVGGHHCQLLIAKTSYGGDDAYEWE